MRRSNTLSSAMQICQATPAAAGIWHIARVPPDR
jgi:hypothetical protein